MLPVVLWEYYSRTTTPTQCHSLHLQPEGKERGCRASRVFAPYQFSSFLSYPAPRSGEGNRTKCGGSGDGLTVGLSAACPLHHTSCGPPSPAPLRCAGADKRSSLRGATATKQSQIPTQAIWIASLTLARRPPSLSPPGLSGWSMLRCSQPKHCGKSQQAGAPHGLPGQARSGPAVTNEKSFSRRGYAPELCPLPRTKDKFATGHQGKANRRKRMPTIRRAASTNVAAC